MKYLVYQKPDWIQVRTAGELIRDDDGHESFVFDTAFEDTPPPRIEGGRVVFVDDPADRYDVHQYILPRQTDAHTPPSRTLPLERCFPGTAELGLFRDFENRNPDEFRSSPPFLTVAILQSDLPLPDPRLYFFNTDIDGMEMAIDKAIDRFLISRDLLAPEGPPLLGKLQALSAVSACKTVTVGDGAEVYVAKARQIPFPPVLMYFLRSRYSYA